MSRRTRAVISPFTFSPISTSLRGGAGGSVMNFMLCLLADLVLFHLARTVRISVRVWVSGRLSVFEIITLGARSVAR
jgi:hypothetical protein